MKVIISLIITLIFITGCSNFRYVPEPESKRGKPIPVLTTTVYSGNFTTEQIRGLWMTCSIRFSQVSPYLPQQFVLRHCDCYADLIRKNFKNSDDLAALIAVAENVGNVLDSDEFACLHAPGFDDLAETSGSNVGQKLISGDYSFPDRPEFNLLHLVLD